mmetsp:Transcript_430/g.1360  ORF Transcript_430/g.1360 Transcript_430/m.1360 type:complete len:201 (-) Transcript_430:685-1287(-)
MGAPLSATGVAGSACAASSFIGPQSGCCTYRMPCEGTMTTTVLPAASGRHATSHAYLIAAPADGPTIIPSSLHTLVAHATHSGVDTWPHSSTTPRGASESSAAGRSTPSRNFEWKPGIQPTMPCLPIGAPVCMRASLGSSATTLHCGFCDFRKLPTPAMQPPVPMPCTKKSTCPPACAQISGPVCSTCASGLCRLDICPR